MAGGQFGAVDDNFGDLVPEPADQGVVVLAGNGMVWQIAADPEAFRVLGKYHAIGGKDAGETDQQKKELAAVKQQIASLPRGRRAAEGKRLRAAIRERYAKMKKRLPTSAKKSLGEMVSMIKGIKTLRI